MTNRWDYAYVARKQPCGCLVGLAADVPGFEKDTAQSVSQWIRKGCAVNRLPHNEVTQILKSEHLGCECEEKKKANCKQPDLFAEEA